MNPSRRRPLPLSQDSLFERERSAIEGLGADKATTKPMIERAKRKAAKLRNFLDGFSSMGSELGEKGKRKTSGRFRFCNSPQGMER